MKTLAATILLFTLAIPAFAHEDFELVVGDRTVIFNDLNPIDENGDSIPDKWSYYALDEDDGSFIAIVASGYDTTEDENVDLWLVYEDGSVVLEAYDTDLDGEADAFIRFGSDEEVIQMTGAGIERLERTGDTEPFIVSPNERSIDDIVGDLSDIDELYTKGGFSFMYLLVLLLLAGGGWYYYNRKKKTAE